MSSGARVRMAANGVVRPGLVALGCGVLGLVGGCQSDGATLENAPAPLRIGADGSTSLVMQADLVVSNADVVVCLEGTQSAELLTLSALQPFGGARVTDFGVVTVSDAYSDQPRSLKDVRGWVTHGRTVTQRCGEVHGERRAQTLAIEMTRPAADAKAGASSFALTYRVGDRVVDETVDFALSWCADLDECDAETVGTQSA